MAEATGLRFTTRVLDGGLGLGITMNYVPRMGSPEALAQLLIGQLKERNIVFGLDEAAILDLMRERKTEEEVEIAHGIPTRRGRDAEIELLRVPPSFMALAGEDGRVDYHNVENVSQVQAGEVIARKTPADPGEPGTNIFGKEIRPPAVRDARHPMGKNTALSADGLQLIASKDGFLRWRGQVIDVVEVFAVRSDVDLRTGNIRYQGDVEVYGDVKAGFEVAAGGDVSIFGNVDGGRVVSDNGAVTITGGVLGSSEGAGSVIAQGDIRLGRARFARLESKGGNVTATYAVEHSEIHAAGDLILRAGPAMSCVVEVGGKVDVADVSVRPELAPDAPAEAHSSTSGNRRHHVRAVVGPAAAAQIGRINSASERMEGEVLDLSAGGARVRLKDRLRENQRLRLQFKLPNVDGTLWSEMEVVRTCDTQDGPANGSRSYGVQFTDIEPAIRETIAKYCMAEDLRQHRLTGKADTRG